MSEEVILTLGEYQFGMSTAAHDEMTRETKYRWVQQKRLTREPAMQYMGPGTTAISLKGSIYPHFRGGLGQLPAMRAEAEKGEPLTLVSGDGVNLGRYCIQSISDTEKSYVGAGLPRRIDFSLRLEAYGEDAVPIDKGGDGGGIWGLVSGFVGDLFDDLGIG